MKVAFRTNLLLLLLLISGCQLLGGKGAPHGDATGVFGLTDLDLRCQASVIDGARSAVQCDTIARDPKGNEWQLTELPSDFATTFLDPLTVSGLVEPDGCTIENRGLRQRCVFELQSPSAELEFGLSIAHNGEVQVKKDKVLLPFSIVSYGLVPQIPVNFQIGYTENLGTWFRGVTGSSRGLRQGFQSRELTNPEMLKFGFVQTVCSTQDSIYFATTGFIYRYDLARNTVSLFAGSGNTEHESDYSHSLSHSISAHTVSLLACGKKRLYFIADKEALALSFDGHIEKLDLGTEKRVTAVAVGADDSLYFVAQSKEIYRKTLGQRSQHIAGKVSGGRSGSGIFALEANLGVSHLAVAADHSIYLNDVGLLKRITPDGILESLTTYDVLTTQPQALRPLPDGSVEFATNTLERYLFKDNQLVKTSNYPAQSWAIASMTLGPDGNIYYSTISSSTLLGLDLQGTSRPIIGTPGPTTFPEGKKHYNSQINSHMGVVGPDNLLYLIEHNRIYRVENDGSLKTVLTKRGPMDAYDQYDLKRFSFGPDGKMYVSTSGGIYRIDAQNDAQPTWVLIKQTPIVSNAICPGDVLFGNDGKIYYLCKKGLSNPTEVRRFNPASPENEEVIVSAPGYVYMAKDPTLGIHVMSSQGGMNFWHVDGRPTPLLLASTITSNSPPPDDGSEADLSQVNLSPSHFGFDHSGNIYFLNYDMTIPGTSITKVFNSNLLMMKPKAGGGYTVKVLFSKSPQRCGGGVIKGEETLDELNGAFFASFNRMCRARSLSLYITGSTTSTNFVLTQTFEGLSSVIRADLGRE